MYIRSAKKKKLIFKTPHENNEECSKYIFYFLVSYIFVDVTMKTENLL